jgi:hypothetical protein
MRALYVIVAVLSVLVSACATSPLFTRDPSIPQTAEECRIMHESLLNRESTVRERWTAIVECAHMPEYYENEGN